LHIIAAGLFSIPLAPLAFVRARPDFTDRGHPLHA